jgi:hypothetical protein
MSRFLVGVEVLPSKDGSGQIRLTWESSRVALFDVRSTVRTTQHQGIERFTETEFVKYGDTKEKESLLQTYALEIKQ